MKKISHESIILVNIEILIIQTINNFGFENTMYLFSMSLQKHIM